LTYSEDDGEVFLGRSVTRHKNISDETAHIIDEEIRSVIDRNYQRSTHLLQENMARLHAMAETAGGVLCHGCWILNGTAIGEIGMNSFIAAHYGVPCVFVSGDKAAAEEAQALIPGIETAVVKESLVPTVSGLSQIPTVSLSLKKAREVIKASARAAMSKIDSIKPCRFDPPYVLQWPFSNSKYADDMNSQFPNAIRIDPITLEFRCDRFEDLPL